LDTNVWVKKESVLLLISFSAAIDETANKVTGQNKRSHMKSVVLLDNVIFCGQKWKKNEDKLNQWNFVIKDFGLKIYVDKSVTYIGVITSAIEH
jgi:hypothetical protein